MASLEDRKRAQIAEKRRKKKKSSKKMMMMLSQRRASGCCRRRHRCYVLAGLLWATVLLHCIDNTPIRVGECAPSSSGGSNKSASNRLIGAGLLSNLFRRQTGSSSSSSSSDGDSSSAASAATTTTTESSTETESNDPQTQTELDAQKFIDSLTPNAGNSNESGPTTFRERVNESFGLLRDGVSNQFRSLRENFSETVEDLRDTWSSSAD